MSYDLAVWYPHKDLADSESKEIYEQLCEGRIDVVLPSVAIKTFYAELTSMHPEIDDVSDEEIDNIDLCPWSIAFDKSLGHLIISCVWSKAEYVQDLLMKLAKKYSLALFDPQSCTLYLPE